MKSTVAAASAFLALAAAVPQGPGGFHGGPGGQGPWSVFPSCVSSCWSNIQSSGCSAGDYSCLCSADTISTANKCIDSSSCSSSEKDETYKAIAQLCVNAGTSVTAAPEATWSVTSGKWSTITGGPWTSGGPGGGWPHGGGWHGQGPWPTSALAGEWSVFTSWTSAESITSWPTASSQWAAFTSAHPVPAGLSSMASWWSANGFPGGSAWPTAWTTNSAWSSVWANGPGGPPGWNGGHGWGPFGHGGPAHGWGNWGSSGAWTNGPWTSWWGTDACPPSTWSGWTSGPWSTAAPWTTWSGCSAKTIATNVVTSTITANGTTVTTTKTNYGIQVAAATNGGGNGAATSSTSPGAAMATNFKMAGTAAGMVGVVAGALLL